MDATAAATLFAWLDRELWLVTAQAGEKRGGLIATSVSQASLVPDMPRVLVGLGRQTQTWGLVEEAGSFVLHLIGEGNLEWVWRFGLHSGRDMDKFEGLTVHPGPGDLPVLPEAIGWLACRVETRCDLGDRTLYVADVIDGKVTQYGPPLTVRRLVELAPPDRLAELKRQRHFDSLADARAIEAWREERSKLGV